MTIEWTHRYLSKHHQQFLRALKRAAKDAPCKSFFHERINQRAATLAYWSEVEEDGQIAVIRSGMDCDCTQYFHVTHIPVPTSVIAWDKGEDEHRQWLDGPEHLSFGRPSECPETNLVSDRALEAYEDGHPSYVTWADTSEMRERL